MFAKLREECGLTGAELRFLRKYFSPVRVISVVEELAPELGLEYVFQSLHLVSQVGTFHG